MRRALDALDSALSRLEFLTIAILSIAALVLGTAQVVLRYVFNTGFTWSEAIFVLLTVSAMLFGGSRAVRDDGHVKVDLLPQLLPGPARKVLRLARYLAALALCGFFAWAGARYVGFTYMMGIVSPATELPVWAVFLLVPITMGLFALRYLILLAREAGGEETGRSGRSEAALAVAEREAGE